MSFRVPKFRVFTWVIVVINTLFLVWVISGIAGNVNNPNCTVNTTACQIGTGIGVFLIFMLWIVVDFILGILWLVTRPSLQK
jgi:hypothetical protein